MAVVSWREVIGRNQSHRFGESPSASRKFVVTMDEPNTNAQDVLTEIGIAHMDPHPEWAFLKMTNVTCTMGSPTAFHAEVSYEYEIYLPDVGDPDPLARADVWSFSTSGTAVPAFYYYDDDDVQRVLVNSAKDFFEGAMTDEAEVRATISGNRPDFPLTTAVAVTNAVNSAPWLNGEAHTWKCMGISAQQATEMVNDEQVTYWQVSVELAYRPSGWELALPDVGYNYLESGKKKRAYVIDPDDDTTKIPCASPVALNSNGSIKPAGSFPDILKRRVNIKVDFSTYFGTPSFS